MDVNQIIDKMAERIGQLERDCIIYQAQIDELVKKVEELQQNQVEVVEE